MTRAYERRTKGRKRAAAGYEEPWSYHVVASQVVAGVDPNLMFDSDRLAAISADRKDLLGESGMPFGKSRPPRLRRSRRHVEGIWRNWPQVLLQNRRGT